jgi:transposase-like protein
MNLPELIDKLHSDEACRKHLESIRWPDGVCCPKCGNKSISRIQTRNVFECNACQYQFSVTSGTIFHDSHLPLRTWFLAIHRISESKKGVSANQLKRELGITYKTAWYMCQRIRTAMAQPTGPGLRGIVEMDETYVGGKPRKGADKKSPGAPRGRGTKKTPVVGMKERDGQVRCEAMPSKVLNTQTLGGMVRKHVDRNNSTLITDEYKGYTHMKWLLPHQTINHRMRFVDGDIHTNGIESFWALLKRGIIGSYHHVSDKHLQRYVDEYCWRTNKSDTEPLDLFDVLLNAHAKAEPIAYKKLIKKESCEQMR